MPKLPKGMYRRGKAYYLRIQRNGRDSRRSLGSDFEEAVDAYRAIMNRPHLLLAPKLTVAQGIKRWLASAVATRRIESGQRDVAARMQRYVAPAMGEWFVSALGPDDLLRFRASLEEQGCRLTLVHRVLSDLRSFLRWAALEGRIIAEVPLPRRLLPRLQQRFPRRLTDEEVKQVSAIREPYGFVVRFGLATGLRWGELTRARAEHVERGVLLVEQTKSGKVRRVPLAAGIQQELDGRSGVLVPFKHPGTFARRVRHYSGVSHFHPHLMRHTFACRWVEAGGNLAVLQALLGHSSIVVTQRYARLSDEAVAAEVARLSGQSGTVSGTTANFHARRHRRKLHSNNAVTR